LAGGRVTAHDSLSPGHGVGDLPPDRRGCLSGGIHFTLRHSYIK
jgi:hypothetical protein